MLGKISLNISFILYLFVYLPQVIHNRKTENILSLSLLMHFMLYISYWLDVMYGYSCNLQWQYKAVSLVGFILLIVQHLQIINHFKKINNVWIVSIHIFILVMTLSVLCYFFVAPQLFLNESSTNLIGYLSRILFIIYTLPQIIKNKRNPSSSNAINRYFIYLNLIIAILDTLSAWCLNWGLPNKLSGPIITLFMLTLLIQHTLAHK